MSQLDTIVASLRQEKAALEAQISRVDAAISALAGVSADLKQAASKAVTKTAATKRTRTPMTAAQKKQVSARMKKYWAARKKGLPQRLRATPGRRNPVFRAFLGRILILYFSLHSHLQIGINVET